MTMAMKIRPLTQCSGMLWVSCIAKIQTHTHTNIHGWLEYLYMLITKQMLVNFMRKGNLSEFLDAHLESIILYYPVAVVLYLWRIRQFHYLLWQPQSQWGHISWYAHQKPNQGFQCPLVITFAFFLHTRLHWRVEIADKTHVYVHVIIIFVWLLCRLVLLLEDIGSDWTEYVLYIYFHVRLLYSAVSNFSSSK